ncbi:hypothetical protein OG422_29250 [Streptomyces sp. NBC_01525]
MHPLLAALMAGAALRPVVVALAVLAGEPTGVTCPGCTPTGPGAA